MAVAIAEAKYHHQVSLEAASRLFRDPGRPATTSAYGFDRHWRNLRTHTVHDPVAYKARGGRRLDAEPARTTVQPLQLR